MKYEVDLTDEQAQSLVNLWTDFHHRTEDPMPGISGKAVIRDAIRAQMPKPRMAEPGWGEKVIAHTKGNPARREVLRAWPTQALGVRWNDGLMASYRWSDLIDPEPVDAP